jgi:hypothetical protein
MRNLFLFLALVFFAILIISKSKNIMKEIVNYKTTTTSLLGSDKYRYGDLYGMSYLPFIKETFGSDSLEIPIENYKYKRKVNLCLVHDSYLGTSFLNSKHQIPGVDTIFDIGYPWWTNTPIRPIKFDKTKSNILLFEIVERNFNLLDSSIAMNLVKLDNNIEESSENISFVKNTLQILFNNDVDRNLEFILLDSKILTPIKEFKSSFNYILFDKINSDVFISKNSNYLFYSKTISSIRENLSNNKISKKITLLNNIYFFYKNLGFDEVYFSIIPNPISVIKPDCRNYNNLIPTIQRDKKLKMKMIDIYSIFKDTKYRIYYYSDTHWNKNGFCLWLNEFNRVLSINN